MARQHPGHRGDLLTRRGLVAVLVVVVVVGAGWGWSCAGPSPLPRVPLVVSRGGVPLGGMRGSLVFGAWWGMRGSLVL